LLYLRRNRTTWARSGCTNFLTLSLSWTIYDALGGSLPRVPSTHDSPQSRKRKGIWSRRVDSLRSR
jgi:hypothetical protein